MLSAIQRHFPKEVAFTEPEGGMFTWLTFPEDFDAAQFMQNVAILKAKVAFVGTVKLTSNWFVCLPEACDAHASDCFRLKRKWIR